MARIMVVDDEPKLSRLISEMLELAGHEVVRANGGRAALVELAARPLDLVITDLRMAEVDGLSVLREARARPDPPEVVMITAHGSAEIAVEAMKEGAADYLLKPFALEELRIRVRRLTDQRAAGIRNRNLVERLTPALIAESARMKAALESGRRVAGTDTTVLLLGESGTGKSQLARFVHQAVQAAGAIEQGILGVQMQMNELGVSHIFSTNLPFAIRRQQARDVHRGLTITKRPDPRRFRATADGPH